MNSFVAVDWSNEDQNLAVYSGKKITRKMPVAVPGLVIATENMPLKQARPLIEGGALIFRCKTNEVAKIREARNIEKTHDNDVKIIHELYETKPEVFRPLTIDPVFQQFKALYASFKGVQELRIATSNRLYADDDAVALKVLAGLELQEKEITKALQGQLEQMPIYTEFLRDIDGIGAVTAAGLLAYVGDINKFPSASHLNSYFGLGVVDGKAPRRQKGQTASWHHKGRSLIVGVIGDMFLKQRPAIYRDVYDREKAKQVEAVPLWHAHKRAIRKSVKCFMKDFFQAYKALGRGDVAVVVDNQHRARRLKKEAVVALKKEAEKQAKASAKAATKVAKSL